MEIGSLVHKIQCRHGNWVYKHWLWRTRAHILFRDVMPVAFLLIRLFRKFYPSPFAWKACNKYPFLSTYSRIWTAFFFFFFFLGKHLNLLNKGYSKEIQSRKVLPWNSLLPSFFSLNQGLIPAHWQCGCPKRGNLSFVWLYGRKLNPVNVLLGLAIRLCSFQTTAVMCFPTRKKAAVFCLIVISKISVALFSNLV